ncbi:MAG: TIGR00266 family protein [Bacteroidales bacterium]|nr:TIGR00266 family protein [Bacteroidales bacterium]
MNIDIKYGPGSSAAQVTLEPGEHFTAEGGSMISMSGDMKIETSTHKREQRGLRKALKRMLSGEGFFMNHYTAGDKGGEVWLATALAGDMMAYDLKGEKLIVQSGSYVASSPDIEIDFNWQGLKLFAGESMFWLNLNGTGKVIINSYGAIYPVEVDGEYIVDTGHIVAFQDSLSFKVTKAGSLLSAILGGEGFVCKFSGKGTVYCQSHNPTAFGKVLGPKLKPRKG